MEKTQQRAAPVEFSVERYYQTLAETFRALDTVGAGHLKKIAVAVSGVESGFGAPALFRREQSNPDRYIGVYQLGTEHSQYLNRTPEAEQLRALGVMKGSPLPGRGPYDPYKNQGVLGAVALMHYADIARNVTGKADGELTARDVWTLHLFGQNGGKALMEAAHKNPDMPLHDLTFKYQGRDVTAVSRAAYNGNIGPAIKGINSEGVPYNRATVGQAFDFIQRHFDRRATEFPAHLNAEYRNEFLIAARTEQPSANPDQPEQELANLNRINRQQQERIAQAARRQGVAEPHQQQEAATAQASATAPLTREQVQQVQQVLIAKGFSDGLGRAQADGIMGKRTRDTLNAYNKATQSDLIAQVKEGKAEQLIAEAGAAQSQTRDKVAAALDSQNGAGRTPPESVQNAAPVAALPQEQNVASTAPAEKLLDIPALSQETHAERRYIANAQRLLGITDQNRPGFLEKHGLGLMPSAKEELKALEGDVKRIQQALADAGEVLSKFGVDGKAGKETYNALLSYRAKNGGQDLPQWVAQRNEAQNLEGKGGAPLPPHKPAELKQASTEQAARLQVADVAENGPPMPTPKKAADARQVSVG